MELINATDVIRSSTDVISGPKIWSIEHLIPTSVILGIIIVCAIICNAFVIAAIILEKNLHFTANYLILSLAVADFIIACVVMPISAVNEVTQRWFLGTEVCHMWIYMDVLCCTASILSLLAISIDRYRAVRDVDYMYTRKRTTKRFLTMVAGVWLVSMLIALPSIVIKDDNNDMSITGICIMSLDPIYIICATIGSFYLPTTVLLIINVKIFIAARERILRKKFSREYQVVQEGQAKQFQLQTITPEITFSQIESSASISDTETTSRLFKGSNASDSSENLESKLSGTDKKSVAPTQSKSVEDILHAKKEKEKLKRKRERKLALTLTIITAVFILCWLPFFVLMIMTPFISSNEKIPKELSSITLWLGYCNSLLNPIIYTVLNECFRKAFKNLLRKCVRRFK